MGITVFISLYTTRLILASLGESDFGIFNIVGGAIGMLGFLNSTLANATQRFMSYAEGEGHLENKKKIFNVSIALHILIALVTAVLLFAATIPLFNGILNIDPGRVFSAKIVYISVIISTLLTIVNVPYDAVMNAHENMLYYSVIGVLESVLRLAVAFACVYTTGDKLIVYGILMACIPLVSLSIMKVYCHKNYEECSVNLRRYWDFAIVKKIASFSGWNFLTAVSSLFSAQGIGLVLNHFFGTRLNAAQGVANQVNGQLSAFSLTMLKALNPVIVKNAGSKDVEAMNRATLAGCKYSPLIVMFFAIPFIIEMDYILGIWLKDVPEWTSVFCNMVLIQTIICQMANPAATAVYGQGDIKWYAIWKSVMNIAPVVLVYIAFKFGGSPIWLYIPMITVWAIGGDVVIMLYAARKCQLNLKIYGKTVVAPMFVICLITFTIGVVPSLILVPGFPRLIFSCVVSSTTITISTWFFGMETYDKSLVYEQYRKLKNIIYENSLDYK